MGSRVWLELYLYLHSVPAWQVTGQVYFYLYLSQLFGKSCSFRDSKVMEEEELSRDSKVSLLISTE
jgi:hypothetical protein